MGNETSKHSPTEFESIPDLYKFLLEETFQINCQLCEEFLSRYNVGLIMSIHALANTLYERNVSVKELQEMHKSFGMVMKQHKKRVFQFTHKKCKGRYKKFPEDIIKNVQMKEHNMHKTASEISEFASDFGTEERKFNVFLYGKIEHIKNELKIQIENSMESLLPEVIYKRKVCSEALCIDGGDGKVMRYKVCPVEADFFPGNPYTVKPVKQDSLQFKESQYYVWIENGKLNLWKTPLKDLKKVHTFVVPTLELNGNVLVELEGTIEFSCTKEAKISTKEDGRGSQILLYAINQILQSKESKIFKTRVRVVIEMTTALLKMKPKKNIKMTSSDVENFNKLYQEVQFLEVNQSMYTQNEEEAESSTASSFNTTSTSKDSQNNRNNDNKNQNDSVCVPHVQSDTSEDLPRMGFEFLGNLSTKMVTSLATRAWDDIGRIVAVSASKTAGRVLQRMLIPVGIAWWSYNIWHFVKDYRESKITVRQLIRKIGRYVVTDIGTAGLACLISTLVAGPAGFLVGMGLAAVLSPLDYFLGDRIANFILPRSSEEEMARRTEQLRKKKKNLLRTAYKILNIEEHASNWEVERAYKDAALVNHPDKVHRAKDVGNKFDAIHKSYNLIKQERSLEDQECGAGNNTVRPIQAIKEG
ncbi:unnamed protein product [Mytilus coruscus]|uniref:J domain-containing protein n=1 Tax=Mytilus coruscus TaxID=42192 RepID=A0A6J8ASN3_MYTCO|nr:unnamed protein product [Mytilus coruscus]